MKHRFALARNNYTLPDARLLKFLRTTVTHSILLDAWRSVSKTDAEKYLVRWYRDVLGLDEKALSMYEQRIALGVMLWNMHDRHGHNGLQYALDHVGQQVAVNPEYVARLKQAVKKEGFDVATFDRFLETIRASLESSSLAESTPVSATPSPEASVGQTPSVGTPMTTPASVSPATLVSPKEEVPEQDEPEKQEEEVPEEEQEEEVPEEEEEAEVSPEEEEVVEEEQKEEENKDVFGDLLPRTQGSETGSDIFAASEETGLGHDVAEHVDKDYCAIRDQISQFVDTMAPLLPELRKFAASPNWVIYTDQYVREIRQYLGIKPENTPECKRIVEAVTENLGFLILLVQQAYINMMRFEAQNTINVLKPDEYRDFMLSLAIDSLPQTVPEAERLSRLRPV